MKWYLQLLGGSTGDLSLSVLVHFDSRRYLFNCGESLQRYLGEARARPSKLTNVFLTRLDWDTFGGFPGLCLTLADAGTRQLQLLGPPNITHAVATSRYYVYRKGFSLDTFEFGRDGNSYFDGTLKVTPVMVTPQLKVPIQSNSSPHPSQICKSPSELREIINQCVFSPFPNLKDTNDSLDSIQDPITPSSSQCSEGNMNQNDIELEPELSQSDKKRLLFSSKLYTERHQGVLSYICQGPTIPGRFDANKALELGIPNGPIRSQLCKGEAITTPDGRVVHPQDCIGPSKQGDVFIIVDCPHVDYIPSLTTSQEFFPYQMESRNIIQKENEKSSPNPCVIIHLVGEKVLEDKEYIAWMNSFGAKTQHLVSGKDVSPDSLLYKSSSLTQAKLNLLHSDIFPLPYYSSVPAQKLPKSVFSNTQVAADSLIIDIQPKLKVNRSLIPKVSMADEMKQAQNPSSFSQPNLKNYYDSLQDLKKGKFKNGSFKREDDVVVSCLGTGSMIPSKYRNVSSNLVTFPNPKSHILLDCGEGTLGQLFRHLGGWFGLDDFFLHLKCIFISHMHADHHLGTTRILKYYSEFRKRNSGAIKDSLLIVGPFHLFSYLLEYSRCEDIGMQFVRYIHSDACVQTPTINNMHKEANTADLNQLLRTTGLKSFITVPVVHCFKSYGLVMEHSQFGKIVFSGDTRPCDALIQAGKNAELLIHEATFEEDKKEEAIARRHSTLYEAIGVGERMKARRLLLTHISQRYPRLPYFSYPTPNSPPSHKMNVAIAFDLMRFRLSSDFPLLEHFLPCLQILFGHLAQLEEELEVGSTIEKSGQAEIQKVSRKKRQNKSTLASSPKRLK